MALCGAAILNMRQEADGLSALARESGHIRRNQPVSGPAAPISSGKRSILRIAVSGVQEVADGNPLWATHCLPPGQSFGRLSDLVPVQGGGGRPLGAGLDSLRPGLRVGGLICVDNWPAVTRPLRCPICATVGPAPASS